MQIISWQFIHIIFTGRCSFAFKYSYTASTQQRERVKAGIRARVEHPFRISSASSGMPRCITEGWPKTRHSCTHCLRWSISG